MSIFGWINHSKPESASKVERSSIPGQPLAAAYSLAQIRPSEKAVIKGFAPELAADRRIHLQAYGVLPGRSVYITQHSPVVVLRVDHLEIALETEMARQILVEMSADVLLKSSDPITKLG